jgi:hypothetical protein
MQNALVSVTVPRNIRHHRNIRERDAISDRVRKIRAFL